MDWRHSLGFRALIIGFVTFVLMIPAAMLAVLVEERSANRDRVMQEIAGSWGGEQTLSGPFLAIPFTAPVENPDSQKKTVRQFVYILPDTLKVRGRVQSEIRYRGIYQSVVYRCDLTLEGTLRPLSPEKLPVPLQELNWKRAVFLMGITDMKGVEEVPTLTLNGQRKRFEPGLADFEVIKTGMQAPLTNLNAGDGVSFEIHLRLKGRSGLYITPVGSETKVELSSSWPSPSFQGTYLPVERSITPEGFTARWRVLEFNRTYPRVWVGSQYDPLPSRFGVSFYVPLDVYRMTIRSLKYSFLIIFLTFLTFFLFEIKGGVALHPIHYLFVGAGLIIFYLLLLSLGEFIRFHLAYFCSAIAILILITLYVQTILKNLKKAGIVFCALSLLYGYIYLILNLVDYALLAGSIGLFVILAVVMFITRNVDWYHVFHGSERKT